MSRRSLVEHAGPLHKMLWKETVRLAVNWLEPTGGMIVSCCEAGLLEELCAQKGSET